MKLSIKDIDKKNTDLLRIIDISCITSNIYNDTKDEDDILGEAYIKFCEEYNFDRSRIVKENRFKFRKSELVKDGYDPDKSEREIMKERNIPRIYDCGNIVYEWTKPDE